MGKQYLKNYGKWVI